MNALNSEGAKLTQRQQRSSFLHSVPRAVLSCVPRASSALSLVLALTLAGCGTKTELLLPDGKPNPAGQKDPSQPPSPISR
jgi:predicted small lipoprotein YifL